MKNNIDDSVNLCSPSLSVSESGNEELCSELSPDVDGVSDSPYMSSNHQTNEQPEVGRGLPSIDDATEYVWVRHMGSPASGNVLRLIDSIFIWMVLWIPHAVKVEPLKAKLPIWFVWLAAIAALFALAIVGVAR